MRSLPSLALSTLLSLLVLLSGTAVAQAQEPVDADDVASSLDAFLRQQVAQLDIPALVFVLVQDGEVLFASGYGLAYVADQIPMRPDETVMRIGSVSKLFVATAVMQLVERGELEVTALGDRLIVRDGEYASIGPGLFQEVGGKRRIAFRQDTRGRVSYMFWGPYAYRRLPWYERASFHRLLFESTGWVWVALGVLWPLMCLLRRLRQRTREPHLRWGAYWVVVLMAVLNGAFLLSLDGLFWRSPETQKALLVLPLVSLAAGVGVLVLSGVMWWRRRGSLAGRLYFMSVALAALLFAWFLDYWNFLGYHLG